MTGPVSPTLSGGAYLDGLREESRRNEDRVSLLNDPACALEAIIETARRGNATRDDAARLKAIRDIRDAANRVLITAAMRGQRR